jgi:hypothetical protein
MLAPEVEPRNLHNFRDQTTTLLGSDELLSLAKTLGEKRNHLGSWSSPSLPIFVTMPDTIMPQQATREN